LDVLWEFDNSARRVRRSRNSNDRKQQREGRCPYSKMIACHCVVPLLVAARDRRCPELRGRGNRRARDTVRLGGTPVNQRAGDNNPIADIFRSPHTYRGGPGASILRRGGGERGAEDCL